MFIKNRVLQCFSLNLTHVTLLLCHNVIIHKINWLKKLNWNLKNTCDYKQTHLIFPSVRDLASVLQYESSHLFFSLNAFLHGVIIHPCSPWPWFLFSLSKLEINYTDKKADDRRACSEDKEINKADRNWAVPTYGNVFQTLSVTELI